MPDRIKFRRLFNNTNLSSINLVFTSLPDGTAPKLQGTWSISGGYLINSGLANVLYPELLANGDFETWVSDTNTASWSEYSTGTGTINKDTDSYDGTYDARIDVPAEDNNTGIKQTIVNSIGDWVIGSVYVKSNPAGKTIKFLEDTGTDFDTYFVVTGSYAKYNFGGRLTVANRTYTIKRESAPSTSLFVDLASLKKADLSALVSLVKVASPYGTVRANWIRGTNCLAPMGVGMNVSSDMKNGVFAYLSSIGTLAHIKLVQLMNGLYVTKLDEASSNYYYPNVSLELIRDVGTNTYRVLYSGVQVGTDQTISGLNTPSVCTFDASTGLDLCSRFTYFLNNSLPNISIIGDSIEDGAGTWVYYPITSYWANIKDHAVSGQSIISNMDAQVVAAASDNASIIILALGTNDNNAGDMAALQAEVEENIIELKGTNPGARIYYFNVLPKWTDALGGTSVDKSNIRTAIAAACTAQSITCWDTYTTPWITAADTSDGTHPNASGKAKIVAQVLARLG